MRSVRGMDGIEWFVWSRRAFTQIGRPAKAPHLPPTCLPACIAKLSRSPEGLVGRHLAGGAGARVGDFALRAAAGRRAGRRPTANALREDHIVHLGCEGENEGRDV